MAIRQLLTKPCCFCPGIAVCSGQSLFFGVGGGDDLDVVVVTAALVTLGCGLGWRPMAEVLVALVVVGMWSVVILFLESPDTPVTVVSIETVVCPGAEEV